MKTKILESSIQNTICEYLTRKRHFFWRQNNNPIYDSVNKKFRAMPKYAMLGISDIIVITQGGFVVFLEVKQKGGKQSDGQKEFQRRCVDKGAEYRVVSSLEDVIQLGL